MQFPNRVRMALQKTVLFSSPTGPQGERIRYAPTTGYVRSFEIPMRSPNRVCVTLQKTVLFSSPSKHCPVFVPYGAVCGAYAIRPYNRVRAILRNTDAILQLGTCGPSKNYLVFVPFWTVCGAYAIRPYNWVRVILWSTDAIPQPATCDPMKYRRDLSTGGAGVFGRWGGGDYRLRGRWA